MSLYIIYYIFKFRMCSTYEELKELKELEGVNVACSHLDNTITWFKSLKVMSLTSKLEER